MIDENLNEILRDHFYSESVNCDEAAKRKIKDLFKRVIEEAKPKERVSDHRGSAYADAFNECIDEFNSNLNNLLKYKDKPMFTEEQIDDMATTVAKVLQK